MPKTTQVLEVPAARQLRVVEQPLAAPTRGEVRVRITAGGLCGTDLHVWEGAMHNLPRVPGHDVAGVIDALGPGVAGERLAERVTIDPAACCARAAVPGELCARCKSGATHLCEHRTYMGISAPGAFAERVVVPAARAVPLPDTVDDATATVLEPVVVALHLEEQIADRPGSVLVIGGGPIGAVAAVLLQHRGRRVTVSEPMAVRRELVTSWGVVDVRPPEEVDGDLAPDVIVEASGHPSAVETIARVAGDGCTIVLIGGSADIPGGLILTRELEVRAAKGGRGLYPEAIELVRQGVVRPGELVSHIFPVRQAAEAFEFATSQRQVVSRALLDMSHW